MKVSTYKQQFILHRTVGQIYALLFVSKDPLHSDDIVEALSISRSNVSMGIKELKSWRLIRSQHLPNDRREYYSAPEDIWEIFRVLVDERRRREIDPTLTMLRSALLEEPSSKEDQHAAKRLQEMHDLIELTTNWVDEIQLLPPKTAIKLLKLGGGVTKLLSPGSRKRKASNE